MKERFTIPYFNYDAPRTLPEAVRILGKYGSDAALAAGGTTILVDLKRGDLKPPKMLVDISRLRSLEFVKFNRRTGLRVGALTKLEDLGQSKVAQEKYPVIVDAIRSMGTVQVCNMATVGGNICGGSPCSDLAVPLLVLEALLTLRSRGKVRKVEMEDLYTAPYKTCLKSSEMLTEIQIPYFKDCGMAFMRFGRTAVDLGLAKVAVLIKIGSGRRCSLFRLGIGTATKIPKRIRSVEKLLTGRKVDETWGDQVAKVLEDEEYVDDWRASSQYRMELCKVLSKRALQKAITMAEGK